MTRCKIKREFLRIFHKNFGKIKKFHKIHRKNQYFNYNRFLHKLFQNYFEKFEILVLCYTMSLVKKMRKQLLHSIFDFYPNVGCSIDNKQAFEYHIDLVIHKVNSKYYFIKNLFF